MRRPLCLPTTRECITLPDGDGLELHHLAGDRSGIRVLVLHGLEGSAHSHYVGGFLSQTWARQWGATVLVFRGCGDIPNTARRFYHSGETTDLSYVFQTLAARWPESIWCLVGVSLGGNVLLKWLGELGENVDRRILAAAVVSVPFDLEAGSRHISRAGSRVYDRSFLRSLRRKALAKLRVYPDLFDRPKLERARRMFEFDEAVTAPVHGFADARDYYAKSSSVQFLTAIRVPTLLLSAADDPFLPRPVLSRVADIAARNPSLTVEFHARGGHVGFVSGAAPWKPIYYAERRVHRFFDEVLNRR